MLKVINSIKKFIWTKILPLKLLDYIRDVTPISYTGKLIRKILINSEYRPDYDTYFNFIINEDEAFFIKRIRLGIAAPRHTWRAVSTAFYNAYPEHQDCVGKGDQMDGQALCRFARDFYGEVDEDGWN